MMQAIHGGDIYRNQVTLDVSSSINPLGMPESVRQALFSAVEDSLCYPDPLAKDLHRAVAGMLDVPPETLVFGNGASELFLAIANALRPRKVVLPVPSFLGYEYAFGAVGSELVFVKTRQENHFVPDERLFSVLTADVDLLVLANPNNPTGILLPKDFLYRLLCHCREKQIFVVLDECFMELCDGGYSLLKAHSAFPQLLLVRAFTKSFGIPGVRLGYLLCADPVLRERVWHQLPEWNLSCFSQAAGCACAKEGAFLEKSVRIIQQERQFLSAGLQALGCTVYPGQANFLLFESPVPLYEPLLERGILIRDCENFRGLSRGFYRAAVRKRKENQRLLQEIGAIIWKK